MTRSLRSAVYGSGGQGGLATTGWRETALRACLVVGAALAGGLLVVLHLYLPLAALFALVIPVVLAVRWRRAVELMFGYMTVMGFITNYLYPATWPLLLIDGLVGCIYLGFLLTEPLKRVSQALQPRSVLAWLVVFLAVLAGVEVFNPNLPSILVGLVGLRTFVYYMPLAVIGYHWVRSVRDASRLLWLMVLLSILPGVVAIWQYADHSQTMLALAPGFERALTRTPDLAVGKAFVRVWSTLPSAGALGTYCFYMLCIGLCLLRTQRRLSRVLLLLVVLGLNLAALFVSGSRTYVFALTFAAALILLRKPTRKQLVVLGIAALMAVVVVVPRVDVSLLQRASTSFDVEATVQRFSFLFVYRLTLAYQQYPLGLGLGSASVSARYVLGGLLMDIVESHYSKMQYELGIFGVVGWALFSVLAAVRQLSIAYRLWDIEAGWLALGLALSSVLILLVCIPGVPLDTPPANIYFWFFLGVVLKLGALDRQSPPPAASVASGERAPVAP